MKPSGRTLDEICDYARECFFKKNGYYATEEDAIRLTDEARKAIRAKKENEQNNIRTVEEILNHERECFYKKNGYYPTEEESIRLTDEAIRLTAEARKAIRDNKEDDST